MLYVELPKKETPAELLAIADPVEREKACAAFTATVEFERIPVPREVEVKGSVDGFVEAQKERLRREAAEGVTDVSR